MKSLIHLRLLLSTVLAFVTLPSQAGAEVMDFATWMDYCDEQARSHAEVFDATIRFLNDNPSWMEEHAFLANIPIEVSNKSFLRGYLQAKSKQPWLQRFKLLPVPPSTPKFPSHYEAYVWHGACIGRVIADEWTSASSRKGFKPMDFDFKSKMPMLSRAEKALENAKTMLPKVASLKASERERCNEMIAVTMRFIEDFRHSYQQQVAAIEQLSNSTSNSQNSSSNKMNKENDAGEVGRFKAHWKGRTANFIVTKDNGGGPLSGTVLEVRDPATGKKFTVHYATGIGKGLFETEESAVGATVSIRFGGDGLPASIKNPANGRIMDTGSGWKIEGYGW
ncbi:MAG TPA: hypothetical protein PLB55_19725 [Prosthecobacter sp.]|nr:hypothetical protein [Prosthecobacter sp.]